jgi:hypothetical protein
METAQLAQLADQVRTHVHSSASASGHWAVAAGRLASLPAHPMSVGRIIFLAVLVLFFCSLFVGAYIWMRRPDFGQLERGQGKRTPEGPAGPG